MWLFLAFMSAALLGCYDAFKKEALNGNAVLPVLFLNTLFSSLLFLPLIWFSDAGSISPDNAFYVASGGWTEHRYILLKAVIVLSSWVLGYFGMKHLPLTIVGPINATRPVMVLVGALLVFGERLNGWQCRYFRHHSGAFRQDRGQDRARPPKRCSTQVSSAG
jgi:drug/metabolite transporter (DMT)-like permease